MELVIAIVALVFSAVTAVSSTLLVVYVRSKQRELAVDARKRHAVQSKKVNTKLDSYDDAIKSVEAVGTELLDMAQKIQQLEATVNTLEVRTRANDGIPNFGGFGR